MKPSSLSAIRSDAAQTQAPQAKLLITNALLLTMVPGQETPFSGYIGVGSDETIIAIGNPIGRSPDAGPTGKAAHHECASVNNGPGARNTLQWIHRGRER